MAWFKKEKAPLQAPSREEKTVRTEGLFSKCEECKTILWKKDLDQNANVCSKCGFHFRVSSGRRIEILLDGACEEFDEGLISPDPLRFVDKMPYLQRLEATRRKTGLGDAVVNVAGELDGIPIILSAMEYLFIGGSMGSVVGEKICRAIERALLERKPIVIVSASGGARMMEGALSLMQMAKISAALARLDRAGIPYISVLTDPTTGGVTASFAMLGDLNIAEPGALIGFAGPRVIEQTIRQKLPEGFQRAEFLLEHGMIDAVVPRGEMKAYIARTLRFFGA